MSGGGEQLVDGRGGEDLFEDTLDLVGRGCFDFGAGGLGFVGELDPQQLHYSPDAGGVGTDFTASLKALLQALLTTLLTTSLKALCSAFLTTTL